MRRLAFFVLLFVAVELYGETYVQDIRVLKPAPLSDVSGRLTIEVQVSRMTSLTARCAGQVIARDVRPRRNGIVRFRLNIRKLPRGPLTVRLSGRNELGECDLYELQLYNTDPRAKDSSGIPDNIPEAATGMTLAFVDDFTDATLSISADGRGTRYNAHKPTFGDFSGWPFSNPMEGDDGPFRLRDGYLIIQARKPEGSRGSTGLLATVDMDGKGFWAKAPFYMECRMTAQSAPGTWPAFWTVTNIRRGSGDELDVIEAYGGWGEGNPNNDGYWCTSHFWNQKDSRGRKLQEPARLIDMAEAGSKTSWSEDFHTYGLYVDEEETVYYLDNQAVFRHPTNSYSFECPHVLMVNYAIGGSSGWKIDLDRYGNRSNMYVDYIRVFQR